MKVFVVFLSLVGFCYGSSKQWQLDVNFDNPNNWDTGKTPCATNRIIFPATVKAVLFQTNISSVKELVLPNDGAIILPNDMTLMFSDDVAADPDCSGEDVTFVRTDTESWIDPDSWQDLDNLVSVETERVPCQFDSVIFPEDKLFNVRLESNVTVGTLSFSGKDYSDDQFKNFKNSEAGKMQFSATGSASVTIEGNNCAVTAGCACGNDNNDMLQRICSLYNCLPTACTDAVTPVGGCCELCGAILTMEYDAAKFNLATFKTKIHDDYHVHDSPTTNGRRRREVDTGEVNTYTSKTKNNRIQLVLTDKAVGSSSGQTAITLAQRIKTAMENDPESFGITSVEMKSSTRGTGGQTGTLGGGSVAGIIIGVIIIVVIVCTLGFLVIRRRSNWFFSKDQPLDANMEIASDIPVSFMEEIPGQPPALYMQSFDNPVYAAPTAQENLYDDPTRAPKVDLEDIDPDDLKKGSKKSTKGKGLPPETLGQRGGFDNPNYASMVESGLDDFKIEDEQDGAKGFDLSKQESDS